MKFEKNTIIVISVLGFAIMLLIILIYTTFGSEESKNQSINQVFIPEAVSIDEYESKLDAVQYEEPEYDNSLPTLFNESNIDSNGYYDPNKEEFDRQRLIDSINEANQKKYNFNKRTPSPSHSKKPRASQTRKKKSITPKVDALEQARLRKEAYLNSQKEKVSLDQANERYEVRAQIYRNQDLELNKIVQIRLNEDFLYKGKFYPAKSTLLYGKVTSIVKSHINIEVNQIGTQVIQLFAYDPRLTSVRGLYKKEAGILEAELKKQADQELNRQLGSSTGVGQVIRSASTLFEKSKRKKLRTIPVANGTELILKSY